MWTAARQLWIAVRFLSVLLLVVTCALWLRSYWLQDDYTREVVTPTSPDRGELFTRRIFWNRGMLHLTWMRENVNIWAMGYDKESSPPSRLDTTDQSEWRQHWPEDTPIDWGFEWYRFAAKDGTTITLCAMGLRLDYSNWRPPQRELMRAGWDFTIPFWMLAATFALPPAISGFGVIRRRRRRRRLEAGRCPKCGYDLRATPGRCPECGAVTSGRAGLSSLP